MIGERLKRARAAAGFSMLSLGQHVGVSANMIKKYEHDENMPSSGVLVRLSKALNVRTEYFFRPMQVELGQVEYRKRSSTPAAILKRIHADVLDQAERWHELANLWPNFPVADFVLPDGLPDRIETLDEVDTVADGVRSSWQLGQNPIPDLVDELEARGILVIMTDVDQHAKFDGLQAQISGLPVIVVSTNWPGDRQRFTLAHELGHLLLQGRLATALDEEHACNRFAGAFLLPGGPMRLQLGETRHRLEPKELYLLKMEYGLSMKACLYRAKDLGIITSSVHRGMMIQFSKNRWNKVEPGRAYPPETTLTFQQLVYRALGEGILGESKAAELIGIPLMRFHQERKLEQLDAVADQ
ncbi:helix-turn-helix domain-containing protein [Halomonas dongshanensis]|uniref:XRE family transcriptional regulator n=1 Tax=Halomonas dongshanensis TaxID=2890835 RepID=A0ABT2EKA9_9GAMM|nr:XRE family transcriptional regulator [Halomonas dongshanensis]MCS2611017.1 XRE family transcriptional regulator [Halomonas dongshanensis]